MRRAEHRGPRPPAPSASPVLADSLFDVPCKEGQAQDLPEVTRDLNRRGGIKQDRVRGDEIAHSAAEHDEAAVLMRRMS